jgi:DNA invertase Pin-like site-specific DNA recombinase/DNA-binding transcriptional MerR regulator
MRAAILCRKSNAQEAGTDEKSVAVQERECRELIARNGWQVVEVFTEDAVSGALMTPEGRPELFRLLAACEAKDRPFDVVVVSHEDRIGRDTFRSSAVIVRIIEAGVRLVSVATGERKLDTPTDELMLAITGFSGSIERHNVSRRVRAKHRDTVSRGGWSGGKVSLGYERVKTAERSELRIHPQRAELVRRIFKLAAQGYGTRAIAQVLNEDPTTRSLRKWSGAGVRDTLTNTLYIGQVVFGLTRDVKRGGRIVRVKSTEPPVTVDRPDLAIIDLALWEAVATRKAAVAPLRNRKGQLQGKPERGTMASRYLLSGMLVCGHCHGPMIVQVLVPSGVRKHTYRYYRCSANLNRGKVCANNRGLPIHEIDEALTAAMRREALTPERLEQVLRDLAAEESAYPAEREAARRTLTDELRHVEGRLARLTEALEQGGEIRSLVDRLKVTEAEQQTLQARLEHIDGLARAAALSGQAKVEAIEVLRGWHQAVTAGPVVARQALRKILAGPVAVLPLANSEWSYKAVVTLGAVIGGSVTGWHWRLATAPTASADVGEEVRTLAREASRRSGSPSSRSWQ